MCARANGLQHFVKNELLPVYLRIHTHTHTHKDFLAHLLFG